MASSNCTRRSCSSHGSESMGQLVNHSRDFVWRCCNCGNGWFNFRLDDHCPMCHNPRCATCSIAKE